jgi:hypothetical protein
MTDKQDRAWRDYSNRFRREVLPKLLESAIFMSIGSEVGNFDVQQATELGAALLMGKPILIVIPRGRTIGAQLRRAADEIIDDWVAGTPESEERMLAAMRRLNL